VNKVSIYGGLGNQMFQYAFNIALNEKGCNSKILFTNFFYELHHSGFNLGRAFKLRLPFPLNLYDFILLHGGLIYQNKISRYISYQLISHYNKKYTAYYEKDPFVYDKNVFNQSSKLFIGIWQVEEYFKDIDKTIEKSFVFKTPRDKKNKQLIKQIIQTNSISIHVRRGDYLDAKWSSTHNVIKDNGYYLNSISYVNRKVEDPQYFVFSDDIQWVKKNLPLQSAIFVDINKGKSSYIDMYLMSLCKHNIIANSTFSWWAAWLNKNYDKIVIMPETWLNTDECRGIFPMAWIKMK
jgi:hypothetical protein